MVFDRLLMTGAGRLGAGEQAGATICVAEWTHRTPINSRLSLRPIEGSVTGFDSSGRGERCRIRHKPGLVAPALALCELRSDGQFANLPVGSSLRQLLNLAASLLAA